MTRRLSASPFLKGTALFLGVGVALAVAAGVVGVSDNPPGILLAYAAAVAVILAFVHRWRTPERFWLLAGVAVGGIVAFAFLHNVFEALARGGGGSGVSTVLEGLGTATLIVALLLCPAALVVGVVGAVTMWLRRRGSSPPPP